MRAVRALFACVALAIVAVVVLSPGAVAGASSTTGSTAAPPSSFICSQGSSSTSASADSYLPINRWAAAASTQHSRLSLNLFNIGNLPNVVQRDFVVGDAQALGNTFWRAGVGLTEAATRFCFADSVAATADGLTATIGRALANGGLIAILLVAAAILIVVRLRRGDRTARHQIVKIVVVVLCFAVMVNGATQTKTNANGSVSFGFGSPGWVITHVYDAASTVASAPAAALSGVADTLSFGANVTKRIDAEDPLSCGNYVNNLRADYRAAYGSAATSNMAATVPLALDAMWEQSGLTTYAYSQFGAANDYAALVYCRLLEANAGISPSTQVYITGQTPGAAAMLSGTKDAGGASTALAWASDQSLGASPNATVDESMVGWAACQTSSAGFTPMEWSSTTGAPVTSEWTKVVDPNANGSVYGATGTVTPKLCKAFFDQSWTGFGPQGTAFEWGDNPSQITAAANGPGGPYPGFADYVNTLHGTANGPAEMLSIMFLISSTVDLVVFGVMAGAVLVAKFSLLFLMAFAALLLLVSLWPGTAASSRLAGLTKHAFSMVLFVTGAQVILSIVAITTSIIMDTGTAVAGQGTFLSLLWMGIAPIAALFIVHHLFKQVLKAPSPFKLSSALAWGAASGGIGAGVATGLDRIANRKAVWGTTKRAAGAIQAPFAAGRLKRHTMEPIGSGAQAALGTNGTSPDALPGATKNGSAPNALPGATKAPSALNGPGAGIGGSPGDTKPRAGGGPAGGRAPTAAGTGRVAPADGAGALAVGAGSPDGAVRPLTVAHAPHQRNDARTGPDSSGGGVGPTDGPVAPAGAVVDEAGAVGAAVAGAAVAGIGAGAVTARALARQRRRRWRQRRQQVPGAGQAEGEGGALSAGGTDVGSAYHSALEHLAKRRGLSLGADGVLRTRTGRVVGAPRQDEVDTRSAAEQVHDDRVLRRAEVRAGRRLNRGALAERASANILSRFARSERTTAGGRALARAAGVLGNRRTLQRVTERTRRAAQELRAKPVHRQLASAAKVGAMGVAAMALMASPPVLGAVAGAYALRRAHKARFGLDALHTANQRHVATFRAAAAADRARRQEEARSAALEQAHSEPQTGGEPKAVDNEPSAEQPPLRDAPSDLDTAPSEWVPPDGPAPSPQPSARPASQAQPSQPSPGPSPQAGVPAHEPPTSAAEVLRNDTGRPGISRHDDSAGEPRPTENESRAPSHLVGNRLPNRPADADEVSPEIRARLDAEDEAGLEGG